MGAPECASYTPSNAGRCAARALEEPAASSAPATTDIQGRMWGASAPEENGQGEIRTLDTGFTGMPVFETGAFSHSATCPEQPRKLGRRSRCVNDLAPLLEELRQQRPALAGAHAGK